MLNIIVYVFDIAEMNFNYHTNDMFALTADYACETCCASFGFYFNRESINCMKLIFKDY